MLMDIRQIIEIHRQRGEWDFVGCIYGLGLTVPDYDTEEQEEIEYSDQE